MTNIWFTSDTHFGHKAILRHMPERGKVFATIDEMDDHLIDENNRVVKKGDILIHAGDFCWKAGRAGHYRARLNVREIHLAQGDHDANSLAGHVSKMDRMIFRKFNDLWFHIQHYPCLSWRKMQHGQFHAYGHSHGLFEDTLNALWPGRRAIDVGIDHAFRLTGEWRPLSLDEVLYFMDHPPEPTGDVLPGVTPGDHHHVVMDLDPRVPEIWTHEFLKSGDNHDTR
jgi:calcineurin-like phosphoesterase family protein